MKRLLILVGFCWLALTAAAQTQPLLRYWTDGDYASRADTVISVGDWQSAVDMQQLSPGVHIICMQVRDTSGQWTAPRSFLFVKTPALEDTLPTVYSYWFDGDYASRVSGQFVDGTPMQFNTDGLSDGPHKLDVRLGNGLQSQVRSYLYLKVTEVEDTLPTVYSYWFDGDYASCVSGQFVDGTPMQFKTDGLSDGPHKLYVRLGNGLQSQVRSYLYLKVTEVEDTLPTVYCYWIDGDFASRVSGKFGYDNSLQFNMNGLSEGVHKLYVRLGDGLQSQLRSFLFVKQEEEDTMELLFNYCFDSTFVMASGKIESGKAVCNVEDLDTAGSHWLCLQLGSGTVTQLGIYTFAVTPIFYKLTVESEDTLKGTAAGSGTYLRRDTAILTATARPGYQFVAWKDGDTTNPRVVTALGDSSFTALFEVLSYRVSVVSSDTVKGVVVGGNTYKYLSQAVIAGIPNKGYHFVAWNDGDTTNPRLVTVLGDSLFTATFAPNSYRLSVYSSDTLKGHAAGGSSYTYLTHAVIAAIPEYGYHFVAWNDGDTTNPRVVIVESDTSFTASFAVNSYRLSVVSSDTVKGYVSGDGSYNYLSQVKISATAEYGYHFTAWNDGDTTNPRVVTVLGDSSFTATFAPNSYRLSVYSSDTLKGHVAGGSSYNYLTHAVIAAIPEYGYHFVAWNDGDTTNPRVVIVESDTSFTATFAVNGYQLSLFSSDTVKGYVLGSNVYPYQSVVLITAVPNYGYRFTHWNDGDTTNPRDVMMLQDTSFTAYFDLDSFQLSVTCNDYDMGNVYGSGSYLYLDTVEIRAEAAAHHHFIRWEDGATENPRTVVVQGDLFFNAIFGIDSHYVRVESENPEFGEVDGDGEYPYGSVITIHAMPRDGFLFVQWSDGNTDTAHFVTVLGDSTFIAYFQGVSVKEVKEDAPWVYAEPEAIVIRNVQAPELTTVSDVSGRILFKGNVTDSQRIAVRAAGVYFVRIGQWPVRKVVVTH